MEYTEGEWKVGKTPPLSNWVVGVNLGEPMEQNVIANLYGNKDDANLVAAAPDMYEVLKVATSQLNATGVVADKRLREMNEALAKAEGK